MRKVKSKEEIEKIADNVKALLNGGASHRYIAKSLSISRHTIGKLKANKQVYVKNHPKYTQLSNAQLGQIIIIPWDQDKKDQGFIMKAVYREQRRTGFKFHCQAIHSGLECRRIK